MELYNVWSYDWLLSRSTNIFKAHPCCNMLIHVVTCIGISFHCMGMPYSVYLSGDGHRLFLLLSNMNSASMNICVQVLSVNVCFQFS